MQKLSLVVLSFLCVGVTAYGETVKGRYIKGVAHTGVHEENDSICILVLEPKEAEFVAVASLNKNDCLKGAANEKALDKKLRGSKISAQVEDLTDEEKEFLETARFYSLPKDIEFRKLNSYKVDGSALSGTFHKYPECKRDAQMNDPFDGKKVSLEANQTGLKLVWNGQDEVIGIPDHTYRPTKANADRKRFVFGRDVAASGCTNLEIMIQEAAFEGEAEVKLRAQCPGEDVPFWAKYTCTVAKAKKKS